MSILIEDSPRAEMVGRISDAVGRGAARGAVITPWTTPQPVVAAYVRELTAAGVEVWFDPTTHPLQMGRVGDLRYYDGYDLWGGPRGDLLDDAVRKEHVDKVFDVQDTLGVSHLAPTVLLDDGLCYRSALALDLARDAVARDPRCWLSIAGTVRFWSTDSAALDAHIGALATLQPAGWFLTVVRSATSFPVPVTPADVHALCRTTRALSEYALVHISHGDLLALPAIAAGATSVGSGWDRRQRVCSFGDYRARDSRANEDGRHQRPTLSGLLGSVEPDDAIALSGRNPGLIERLGGLPPPGPRAAFDRHLTVLSAVVDELTAIADPATRYRRLAELYRFARANWSEVSSYTERAKAGLEWIDCLASGLSRYGATEGW